MGLLSSKHKHEALYSDVYSESVTCREVSHTKSFCYMNPYDGTINCSKLFEEKKLQLTGKQQKLKVYVQATVHSPVHRRTFSVRVQLWRHYDSWVDLFLMKSASNTTNLLFEQFTLTRLGMSHIAKKLGFLKDYDIFMQFLTFGSHSEMLENFNAVDIRLKFSENHVKLKWDSVLQLKSHNYPMGVSRPETITRLAVSTKNLANITIKINWICKRQKHFVNAAMIEMQLCENMMRRVKINSCKNVSFSQQKGARIQHQLFFFRQDIYFDKSRKAVISNNLFSWNMASKICKQSRASLPHFDSRSKQDFFLAVKLLDLQYPIEAVFIALNTSHTSRVTFLLTYV